MPIVIYVMVALVGVAVGSFLNVVIVRVPAGESIVRPPSKCPQCENPIAGRDNIPVISWLLLRGRCRHCGKPISPGYPLVELGNAVLWCLAAWRFQGLAAVPVCVLFSGLLALSVIDAEIYRLPTPIVWWTMGIGAAGIVAVSLIEGEPHQIATAVVGSVAYFLFLFIPAWIYPKGLGFGDVRLAALLGLFLGWLTPSYIPVLCLMAVIIASVLGLVAGIVALIIRHGKSAPFPFGPWLALGCVITILASPKLLDLYQLSPVFGP